jgi:hypothetical protein
MAIRSVLEPHRLIPLMACRAASMKWVFLGHSDIARVLAPRLSLGASFAAGINARLDLWRGARPVRFPGRRTDAMIDLPGAADRGGGIAPTTIYALPVGGHSWTAGIKVALPLGVVVALTSLPFVVHRPAGLQELIGDGGSRRVSEPTGSRFSDG